MLLNKCNIKNIDLFLKANYDINWIEKNENVPRFYVQVLRTWYEHVQTHPARECMLWYNRNMLIGGKPVYYEDFVKSGIVYVHDLFDEKGKVVSFVKVTEKGVSKERWLTWLSLVKCIRKRVKQFSEK